MSWFECVPNISEGRDEEKIDAVVGPARSVEGVSVLDVERDASHHRSVVTLAGEGEPLLTAVFGMIREAVARIDLNHHKGEHPRMGAVDVVPFVPLTGSTMPQAVELAGRLGERVWNELKVPVYLYAAAARRPDHADLADLRHGEFEGIRESIRHEAWRRPDFGEPEVHPTAGIVAIGARPVLIAYNAYLTTSDVDVARRVAQTVRHRSGGLAEVKAKGFEIRERNRAQVSMNLTDYTKTPIHRALEMVRREAARYGAAVEESEIVGLVPEAALLDAAEFYLQLNRFNRANLLERKLSGGPPSGPAETLSNLKTPELVARIAARTPTPGGGSAAALAGAIGAALGEMVLRFSGPADRLPASVADAVGELGDARASFLTAVDQDAAAYEEVRERRKEHRQAPADPAASTRWAKALRNAAEVPLDTARRARRAHDLLTQSRGAVKPALTSDLVTALALLSAAREGAIANVSVNLDELREMGEAVADLEAERDRLSADR